MGDKVKFSTGTVVDENGYLHQVGVKIDATAVEINAACDVSARAPVVITDAATYTLLAANSGKLHLLPDMTQNSAISLPAVAAGLDYEIMYSGVAADAHDHTFDSGSDTNFYFGSVQFHDTDDDSTVDVPSDNDSNSILTINNAYAGTVIKITCDGVNWYIRGIVLSDTTPAFTDQ